MCVYVRVPLGLVAAGLEQLNRVGFDVPDCSEREAGRGGPALDVGFARRPADPHIAAVVLSACGVAVLDRDLGKAHSCEAQRPVAVGGRRGSRLNEVARHHVNRSIT